MIIIVTALVTLTLISSIYTLHRLTNLRLISPLLALILTLSFTLPLSTSYLLPIDSYLQGEAPLLTIWKVNYWITYVLTWIVLPFWQYYIASGEFELWKRIKMSVFEILKYIGMLIVLGIMLLIYMVAYHRESLSFGFLNSLLITTSHLYSLTLSMWLMIHGFIEVARKFWFNTNYSKLLDINYNMIPTLKDRYDSSNFEFKELCNTIHGLNLIKDELDMDLRDQVISIYNSMPENFKNTNTNNRFLTENVTVSEINDKYLIKLHSDFKNKYWTYLHSKSKFESMINKSIYFEDVLNYLNNELTETEWRTKNVILPKMAYIYLLPMVYKILSMILILITFIIIESETLHSTRLSILSHIIPEHFKLMFIILILLLLMTLYSLSEIKLFNIYNIEFNSNSDPISTIFFISYALRVVIPLYYNFTVISAIQKTSFGLFVSGNLKLIPIGNLLNDVIPRLIIIPVLLTFFGVWKKIKRRLDDYFFVDWLEFEDEEQNQDNIDNSRLIYGREIVKNYHEIPFTSTRTTPYTSWFRRNSAISDNVSYDEDNRIIDL